MVDNKKIATLSRDESAAMKGLLISLVVLGHNHFFGNVFPNTWNWLYCFHVSSFFILPFFYPDQFFSWQRLKTNAKRLLWPYMYMFVFLFLMYFFLMKEGKIDLGLLNTFITGNEFRLKHYIGFQYLWFLPAMFSMLTIKSLFTSNNKFVKRLLLAVGGICYIVCWVFFFNSPYNLAINKTLARVSVLSCMLGFSMFFLGYITIQLIMMKISKVVPAVILIISFFMIVCSPFPLSKYVVWFSRAICPIAGFLFLYQMRTVYNKSIVRKLGVISLPIYLFHQPLNFLLCSLLSNNSLFPLVNLVISYSVVMLVSYLIAKLVISVKSVNKFLFPR